MKFYRKNLIPDSNFINVLNTQILPHLQTKIPSLEEECLLLFSFPPLIPPQRFQPKRFHNQRETATTTTTSTSTEPSHITVLYLHKHLKENLLTITTNGILEIDISCEIGEILLTTILFLKSIQKSHIIISTNDKSISVMNILKKTY
ncbi:hypothetical protein TCON_2115 [Astathelohania contejeani]|uniref:Uncharacterized protein n=1 Tax=Astathelohania contejeani TaxID=164912 RepID=A0ABQ7HWX3_9MICR|nr:hypothetical protein TCON_2115 [Thelohania contejeani]